MTQVVLGTNEFTDCQTLLGLDEEPVLQVLANPLRISFHAPASFPGGRSLIIENNELKSMPPSRPPFPMVVATDRQVGLFLGTDSLVLATLLDDSRVHLKLDLRPLGLLIHDEIDGLHIGAHVLARKNFIGCTTAIVLT